MCLLECSIIKGVNREYVYLSYTLFALAEGIMILVRSLQRSKGDVSDPIKYIYY